MIVRDENSGDAEAIRSLVAAAFDRHDEADLVDRLRRDGDVEFSLVALDGAHPVGHALFTRMTAPFPAIALAPVSVRPGFRRQGIAAMLIRNGMARAATAGWNAVFVLGDPAYYGRFGFAAGLAAGFASPYAGPYLMAAELGAPLPVHSGRLAHAPAFAALG